MGTGRTRLSALALVLAAAVLSGNAAPQSLHDRILARKDMIVEPDPKVELAAVRALIVEADAAPVANPQDRALLQLLLSFALSHGRDETGALDAANAGIAILTKAGLGTSPDAVELSMNAAAYEGDLGRRDAAAVRLEAIRAIHVARFGAQSSEVGTADCLIAYNAARQGRVSYAIDHARSGIRLMKVDDGNRLSWLGCHTFLSDSLSQAGRVDEALAAAREVSALTATYLAPGNRGISITLNNLASALNAAGRYAEAEAVVRRALELDLKYRGRNFPDTAVDMRNLAKNIAAQGHPIEAETLFMGAADIFAGLGDAIAPRTRATILLDAAALARQRGDYATADGRVGQALAILAKPVKGDEIVLARALAGRALGLMIAGKPADALPLVEQAQASLGELLPQHPQRVELAMVKGLILARTGHAAEGLAAAQPSAALIEAKLLDSTVARGDLVNLAPSYERAFRQFAAIALAAGQQETAFRAVQLANLSDIAVTTSGVAARAAAANPRVADAARALQDRIVRRTGLDRERSAAIGKSPADVARLDGEIAAADRDIAGMRTALDTLFPDYAALSRPAPITLAALRAALPADRAVLMPVMLDDAFVSIVVTRQGLAWRSSPIGSAAIATAVDDIRAAVEPGASTRSFPAGAAWKLYRALLPADLAAALPRQTELALYGGGALARVPLGVLLTRAPTAALLPARGYATAPWLIRTYSTQAVAVLTPTPVQSQVRALEISFAGIGAPHLGDPGPFGSSARGALRGGTIDLAALRLLPSLPGAAQELHAINTALRPARSLMLLGDDATETRVKAADLAAFRVVAFATHGITGGEAGFAEPSLVMTPQADSSALDDGLLSASEASALKLDADWVILSGCDSAGAGNLANPTYSGLARAFFQAGARSLLVSMWPVRDDAAAKLTVMTVAASKRMSKARALQQAELALMADRTVPGSANPAIWGAFTLLER